MGCGSVGGSVSVTLRIGVCAGVGRSDRAVTKSVGRVVVVMLFAMVLADVSVWKVVYGFGSVGAVSG